MRRLQPFILTILFFIFGNVMAFGQTKHTFAIENGNFVYDGNPIQIHSGEMHYARIPAAYWHHRLKMMHAMGLNAVCTYVFWNHHEVAPGKWDWQTGNHNLRGFIKAAKEEGMLVILRPGPYACAEWEFGGYPWWLQKVKGMEVRTDNQPFLDSCRVYINQLAAQVKDLQVTHGGPLIMMQCENEFGSYVAQRPDIPLEVHKRYSAKIRQQLLDAGIDIPLFTSDGDWLFKEGTIEGCLPTANGEKDVKVLKERVGKYTENKGPYMVAEYYPGWLDHWNEPFQKVSTKTVTDDIRQYLQQGVSFNIYMIHGGTNFGFTAGANFSNKTNIQPDLTSYDYDAPISESGWETVKYDSLRNLIKQYAKYQIPEVPAQIPVIAISNIKLYKTMDVLSTLVKNKPVSNVQPLTFEDLNQGYGYVLYRRKFAQAAKGMMRVPGIADFGIVYINGKKVGELNRLIDKDSLEVDIPSQGMLEILVENAGRINYGSRITQNLKGITAPVTIAGKVIEGNWQMFGLPMETMPEMAKCKVSYQKGRPVFYHGTFYLQKVGDTFLDMEQWGKGIVFVNGVNLGRYWNVGPQQTLYLPGCFLKEGKNEIVIFEQKNDTLKTCISSKTKPVLELLRQEK
jgi:beta-galactosidase